MSNTQVEAPRAHIKTTGYGGNLEIRIGKLLPEGCACPVRLSEAITHVVPENVGGYLLGQHIIPEGAHLRDLVAAETFAPLDVASAGRVLRIPPEEKVFLCLIYFEGCNYIATFEKKDGSKVYGILLQTLGDALQNESAFEEETALFYLARPRPRGH
jgi:hypothetical protein